MDREILEAPAQFGLDVAVTPPSDLARAMAEGNTAWRPIMKRAGFTPERHDLTGRTNQPRPRLGPNLYGRIV